MVNTLTINTLANAAIGFGYFCLSSKFPNLGLDGKNQLAAFCLSAIAQGFFIHRKEKHPQDISTIETISRYSFPYVLIGGASLCANSSKLKANTIAGVLLGTAQVLVSEISSRYMDYKINSSEFGKKEWKEYFNVDVPNVEKPENIEQILNAPCPFWGNEGKRVRDTHMLVLIPSTVNEKPFNLNELGNLIKKPRLGHMAGISSSYESVAEKMNENPSHSYWLLMTKNMVPNSITKEYAEQAAILTEKDGYDAPTALEAATCILTHFIRRGDCLGYVEKKSRHYLGYPDCTREVYTSCKDKAPTEETSNLIIGNFKTEISGRKQIEFLENYFVLRNQMKGNFFEVSSRTEYIEFHVGVAGVSRL